MYTPSLSRRILSGLATMALVLSSFASLVPVASAAAPNWDTTGSYVINFNLSGTDYPHNVSLTQSGGALSGSGTSGAYAWSIDSGSVDGDNVSFTAHYTATDDATTTTMSATGSVAPGGTMSGTWSDNYPGDGSRAGTWATVSGTAAAITPAPTSTPATSTPPTTTSQTIVVSGNTASGENQPGWLFNRDPGTQTPYQFDTEAASVGAGSLHVLPITNTINGNNDKFIGELFLLKPMQDIDSLTYDFRIASGTAADKDQFYMSVYANFGESSPTKFYDCRYDVIPTTGSTGSFTTVTFDPSQTYAVTTRGGAQASPHPCPASPSGMDALSTGSSTIRVAALNVGDTSGSDLGIAGYLDRVVVTTTAASNTDTTTYDFEPMAPVTPGSCNGSTFDDFSLGSVNGQGGWISTGAFDQEVVSNTYGYPTFGCKTLRISDAVTSGSFGDQTFSPSTANEAGESAAATSTLSGGTRTSHFEAQFDLGSAVPGGLQPGMHLSVSPDRGDGSRMSYLRFEDQADGIHVFFDDVVNPGPTSTVSTFRETEIAGGSATTSALDRSVPHTIKFAMDFVDGPANDVVNISIDGTVVHTGTSWEDYYRYDPEQAPNGNKVPAVDSLLFRQNGTAHPANDGKGFLIDNLSEVSGTAIVTPPTEPENNGGGGGRNRRNGSGSGSSSGGEVLGASTGPDAECSTPLFNSYMRMGDQNDASQVILLQWFLNGEMGSSLPLTGFFDTSTKMAVETLQSKYASEILAPWGLSQPTGWFYKFTKWKSNLLSCAGINLPRPVPVIDPGDL